VACGELRLQQALQGLDRFGGGGSVRGEFGRRVYALNKAWSGRWGGVVGGDAGQRRLKGADGGGIEAVGSDFFRIAEAQSLGR